MSADLKNIGEKIEMLAQGIAIRDVQIAAQADELAALRQQVHNLTAAAELLQGECDRRGDRVAELELTTRQAVLAHGDLLRLRLYLVGAEIVPPGATVDDMIAALEAQAAILARLQAQLTPAPPPTGSNNDASVPPRRADGDLVTPDTPERLESNLASMAGCVADNPLTDEWLEVTEMPKREN